METESVESVADEAIWSRVLSDGTSDLPPDVARAVLSMKLPEKDRRRAYTLGQKAQKGKLTPKQKAELEALQRVGMILAGLWSKARVSLHRAGEKPEAA